VVEGVCVTLDPDFDFISVATDYLTAQGYREESIKQFAEEAGDQIQRSVQSSIRVPPKLENTLDRIERDDFYVRADVEDGNDVFEKLAKRLVYGMLLASGAFSTAFLYALADVQSAAVAGVFSLGVAALLYRTFRSKKGTRVTPQFTRHEMRQRRGGE
jgi:predicted unusual protein kinase regulating ubiquinone biosynthesis (AarF/ABC1/UbiB family)